MSRDTHSEPGLPMGWHDTLNLLHVSRYEMLHFVTFYMKQNKSRKQTLESAQYGLEISFKFIFGH